LHQQRSLVVLDQPGATRIIDRRVESVDQTEFAVDLTKQRQAAVGGQIAAVKIGEEFFSGKAGKEHRLRGTVYHVDGLSVRGMRFL
jgi:hypothetical protein